MSNHFRIAILISHSRELPAWEIEMLRNLGNTGLATVDAFIVADQPKKKKESLGLKLFRRFEDAWFRSMPDAFTKSPVTEDFKDVQIFSISDNKKISALDLDIIYSSCLVSNFLEYEVCGRYGLWYMTFGPGAYAQAETRAFWEVMNDSPEIGCFLMIKPEGAVNAISVYEGTTTTVPYSVKNSLNSIGWKSSSFLAYRITELSKQGFSVFFSRYKKTARKIQHADVPGSCKSPSSFTVLALSIRNIFRYFLNKFAGYLEKKRFTILFSKQEFTISGIDISLFIPIQLPKDVFWADPFIIEKEGNSYIFFEEFLYKKGKAHISVLEITNDGTLSKPVIVLDKPYHLSYPFVFEMEGSHYMIPETSENKTVELYKCIEFPSKWEFVKNLMEDIVLIDATLLYHDNKWWLFGTSTDRPFTSTNDQLFLYYSETLFSAAWKPHPQNPVATLISNCRPAGKIFKRDGNLYRPAQNNASKQYGYALKINEIEVLNETEYREKEVDEILPGKKNKLSAVHTINFTGNMIVIDGIPG